MAGLVPAIHVFESTRNFKMWMPGTRPGMTSRRPNDATRRASRPAHVLHFGGPIRATACSDRIDSALANHIRHPRASRHSGEGCPGDLDSHGTAVPRESRLPGQPSPLWRLARDTSHFISGLVSGSDSFHFG